MADIFDLADTWNDAGTTFTAIKMNVTDTASNAASLLMDLQVGGVSKFRVTKGAGAIFGANLFEQRNGTNPQTFDLYNTWTDASNYERGFLRWNANVLEIGTEAAGTGAGRVLKLSSGVTNGASISLGVAAFEVQSVGGSSTFYHSNTRTVQGRDLPYAWSNTAASSSAYDTSLFRSSAGVLGVRAGSSSTGAAVELLEQTAPAGAANAVRIYAEDDGAGKTRLMAVFGTGAAVQIAIEP